MSKIGRLNINNTSPQYWERVLASYGLGIDQPLTDNSDESATNESPEAVGDDFLQLRRKIDKGDRFMEAHEIKKTRGRDRESPEWTSNNIRVREVLLRAFPKLYVNQTQKKKAGRWVRVIFLYHRMRLPLQVVAKEMGMTKNALRMLNRSMNWVAQGLRADGSGKRSMTPPIPPVREPGERGHE